MKKFRFSKIKILTDLIGQLAFSTIILAVANIIFSYEFFAKPANYIVYSTLLFLALMVLLYIFFLFATPTMVSISFDTDRLIIKFVKGFGYKTVFYQDIKWLKKVSILRDRYRVGIKEENIPLTLEIFKKKDRAEIVKTIIKYTTST